jgi:thymidylate synthase (FAD)
MKIITEASVYLLGYQAVAGHELERFLADHDVTWETDTEVGAEVLTETAGRLCYMSYAKPRPGGNTAYLTHIKEVGHGSVLEHAVWNFVFTGVSRTLTHELVRHRAGMGYSQLSQRYVDESVAEYVCPDVIRNDPELYRVWYTAMREAHAAYVTLAEKLAEKLVGAAYLKYARDCARMHLPPCGPDDWYRGQHQEVKTGFRKEARQAARSVLPNATETKIFVTANGRALRHFLEQRGSRFAEPEIRKLAGQVLAVLQAESPALFSDYVRERLPDGTDEITTQYRKV